MSLQSQSPRAAKISLLAQYGKRAGKRGARKDVTQVQPILVDDPWAVGEPVVRSKDAVAEWIAPRKPLIEVYASKRDVIAGMYARGQIDKAMFLAARDYAAIYETAMSLSVRGIDPAAPVVSGGTGRDTLEAVADAASRLKGIETRLRRPQGDDAVALVRDVLGQGSTIQHAAERRGEPTRQGVEFWGGRLQRALQQLAEITGYAVRGAYRNRRRNEERKERERERQERADMERGQRRRKGA